MCDATKRRQTPYTYSSKMRLVGCSQWEFPIPKSTEYWQQICEDVERKRDKVRSPSKLSHPFLYKNKCENSNPNSLSSQSFANSLHEVSAEYESSTDKCSYLKKLVASTDNFTRIEQSHGTSRVPKIGIACLLPSFSRTLLDEDENNLSDGDLLDKELFKKNLVSSKEPKSITDDIEKTQKKSRKKHRIKFSVKCAYKALKSLTANKKLDFTPKPVISISDESKSSSDESSDISDVNITDGNASQESFSFREVHKKLKKSWQETLQSKNTVSESTRLKLDEESSKTVPTSSRSSSGPSPKFVYPEIYENQSKRFLNSIPTLKSTWRKKCDRCFPCIYKTFQPESDKKLSLPKTVLYRTIFPTAKHGLTYTEDSLGSSTYFQTTTSVEDSSESSIETNVEKSVTFMKRLGKFNDSNKVSPIIAKDEIKVETFVEVLNESNFENDEEKTTPTLPVKGPEFVGEISLSTEQAKIPSTLEEETSSDGDSQTVLLIEDPSKSKYLAPCHAPTILCPSLEPFRALRQRQPTTLQARIKLLEGTAGNSDDSSDDSVDEMDSKGGANIHQQSSKRAQSLNAIRDGKLSGTETTESLSLAGALKFFLEMEGSRSEHDAPILTEVESQSKGPEVPFPQHPREFPFDLPLTRNVEILEVLRELPEERLTPMTILETLCKEFSIRVSKYVAGRNAGGAKACNKIAIRLAKLLVDSKRYLRPNQFPSDLVFSTYQPPLSNPRQLRRILPLHSYNLVAPLLRMPRCYPKRRTSSHGIHLKHQSLPSERSSEESIFSLQVQPPSARTHITSIGDKRKTRRNKKPNPYALFLRKPRRKAVTWRPLTEQDLRGYDPEATLDMRAKYKMRQICKEFCDWFRSLGGKDAGIDEDVLEDMFEIDFNADVCRSLQVLIREMPTVPTEVALKRQCPEAGELAMTRRHLIADADAERAPAKVRAFGSTIPWELRHIPPRNGVQKRWLECEHVPRDLETMEVIWKGITHLESVQSFVQWVKDNPQELPEDRLTPMTILEILCKEFSIRVSKYIVGRNAGGAKACNKIAIRLAKVLVAMPKALDKIIAMDMTGERQTEEDEALAQRELDIEQIESFKIR